jgi:hypothetical protein
MKKLLVCIILKILSVLLLVTATVNAFIFSNDIDEFAFSIFLILLSSCLFIGVSLAEVKDIEDGKI